MIVKNIVIHNFFTFEHVDLVLGEGPFFITGNNRDSSRAMSNGAGKSMFIQSIVWCMFDDILRGGILKDDVIGVYDTFCQVKLIIEKDEKIIEIDRVRKHPLRGSSVIVKVDGQNISKHKDKENIDLIEKLLNISMKTLHYSAYSSRAVPSFMTLSPSKMKETVSEILDISRFDKHISEFTKIQKNLKNSIQILLTKLTGNISLKKELQADIVNIDKMIESFNDDLLVKVFELEKERSENLKQISKFSSSIESVDISSIKEELAAVEEIISEVGQMNGKLKELERKKSLKVNEKDRCMTDISGYISRLDNSKAQFANLTTSHTNICVYCNSEMLDKEFIESKSKELSKIIFQLQTDVDLKRVYYETIDASISKLDSKIEAYKDFLKEAQSHYIRKQELSDTVRAFDTVSSKLSDMNNYITNILDPKIASTKISTPENLIEMKASKTERLLKVEEDNKTLSDEIDTKEKYLIYAADIVEAFKDLKSGVFNNFVLELHNSINNNLEELTDGIFKCSYEVKGEELKFTFTDSSKSGKELPFIALSDGERCLISKAVSASLSDIIGTGIIIDDEGLDGADSSIIPFIVDFILRKYKGRTFFFVGHQTVLNDLFDGYSNIHIVKENGKSKAYIS